MMSWFSECILQLCQPEQWCLLHMSGRGLVVIWGSLQLVRPRAGTEHNFSLQRWITFLPLGSPLPHSVFFSLSQLLRCLSLIFLSFLPYSPPSSPLNRNILYPPPPRTHHPPPYLFLDLCSSLSAGLFLPPSIRSRLSSGGNSPSAAGSEFQASFIEFALDSGRACLPIRSWWGASRLWANPQIHLEPACVSKCVYLSVEYRQTLPRILEGLSRICSFPLHIFRWVGTLNHTLHSFLLTAVLLSFLLQFFLVKDFLKDGFLAIYKVKQKEWAPQKEFFPKEAVASWHFYCRTINIWPKKSRCLTEMWAYVNPVGYGTRVS